MEPVETPRVFSDRYELTHLIARGGMAQVYRARDRQLDRPVALKVLFPELSVDRAFVERFRREAQAAANLSHPNIVPVFDWGEDNGSYFIVMEFVDGRPLSAVLRESGPLSPQQTATIGANVAAALAFAHRHGVVHRDVKPGNVLITADGIVKVTDFMKRRLEIARGLMHSPRVLFLDEPTVGLDPQTRSSIWSYIRELKQAEDITIFLTTHYMDEAEYCDRIAIMDQGKIIALDTPEALKASIGKDRVQIKVDDAAAGIAALDAHFGLSATVAEGAVTFAVERGEAFVPRLFADFPLPILSVNVSRPTLDDVFMSYTGSTIRDAEATASQRGREQMSMMRGGRR